MGEIVVITGATAGVGRATARAFAEQGARVALLARGEDRLQATRGEVEERGGRALPIPTDVAEADQVEAAADRVESEWGPIDIWVNNAMTSVFAEFVDIEPAEYRRVTDVVYHGQVHGTRAALRRMLPRDRGTIVLVGSALSYRGIPLQSAYCGAKHATQGMFDSVRSELLHRGSRVHITMVQLPALNTPQFRWVRSKLPRKSQPVPPIFQPEVAAEAIMYAARTRRREVYVGWPTVRTIVGNKLLPGLGDRYLARHGYEGQMMEEAEEPNRPDNLFGPVDLEFEARGPFDERAEGRSLQLAMTKRRGAIAAGLAGLGLAALGGALLFGRS